MDRVAGDAQRAHHRQPPSRARIRELLLAGIHLRRRESSTIFFNDTAVTETENETKPCVLVAGHGRRAAFGPVGENGVQNPVSHQFRCLRRERAVGDLRIENDCGHVVLLNVGSNWLRATVPAEFPRGSSDVDQDASDLDGRGWSTSQPAGLSAQRVVDEFIAAGLPVPKRTVPARR
jgi:hypothetical protein